METPKTVAFHTLGCKLNFAETSAVARSFFEKGYAKVSFDAPADVYVINTCSVTENADKECRQLIRNVLRRTPNARVAVMGCYAQLQPENIAAIPGVSLVLGASEKFNIVERLEELPQQTTQAQVYSCDISEVNFFTGAHSYGDRTRTFLKVQDGCDYSCTFCTIPLARGKSRSPVINEIVKQAQEIANSGVREVVLTGVNIGDFGKGISGGKIKEQTFLELIEALDEVKGINRYRISSIEPNLLNDEIISFVANAKRFAPHFHIPLQSGSNKILGLMRRRYQRDLYAQRVQAIKKAMPHCCIGVDVIVGFPGETHDDFIETYKFLNELEISYLHVFTYSERPNTTAAEMENGVPINERKRRNKMLRNLSEKKKNFFYTQHLRQTRDVLFEAKNENGFISGFTDNYIKVKLAFEPQLVNEILSVKLSELTSDAIIGEFEKEIVKIY